MSKGKSKAENIKHCQRALHCVQFPLIIDEDIDSFEQKADTEPISLTRPQRGAQWEAGTKKIITLSQPVSRSSKYFTLLNVYQ